MTPSDRFDRVATGDPLRIPAPRANAWSDAARVVLTGERDVRVPDLPPGPPSTLVCTVLNTSGADKPERSVMRVSGAGIDPATVPLEFQRTPVLLADVPAAAIDRFVILLEPIKNGKCGRAAHAGLAVVDLNVLDADHLAAVPVAGDSTKLVSTNVAATPVVWKESGTGTKKAVVHLARYRAPVLLAGGAGTQNFTAATTPGTPFVLSGFGSSGGFNGAVESTGAGFDLPLPVGPGVWLVTANVAGKITPFAASGTRRLKMHLLVIETGTTTVVSDYGGDFLGEQTYDGTVTPVERWGDVVIGGTHQRVVTLTQERRLAIGIDYENTTGSALDPPAITLAEISALQLG